MSESKAVAEYREALMELEWAVRRHQSSTAIDDDGRARNIVEAEARLDEAVVGLMVECASWYGPMDLAERKARSLLRGKEKGE